MNNLKSKNIKSKKKIGIIIGITIILSLVLALFGYYTINQKQLEIEQQEVQSKLDELQKEFDNIKIEKMTDDESKKFDLIVEKFKKSIEDKKISDAEKALVEAKDLKQLVDTRVKEEKEKAEKEKAEQEQAQAEQEQAQAEQEQAQQQEQVEETTDWVEPVPQPTPQAPAPSPQPAPTPSVPVPPVNPNPPEYPPVISNPDAAYIASFSQGAVDALTAAGGVYTPGFRGNNEFGNGVTPGGDPYSLGYSSGTVISGYLPGKFDVDCYFDGEYLYVYGYFE